MFTFSGYASIYRLPVWCAEHKRGDAFPHLEFNKAGGGTVSLPDDLAGQWGAVLFYQGHW